MKKKVVGVFALLSIVGSLVLPIASNSASISVMSEAATVSNEVKKSLTSVPVLEPDVTTWIEAFPDEVFRSAVGPLIRLGYDDVTMAHLTLSEENIEEIDSGISSLDVSNLGIESVAGLEHFRNLINFDCSGNQLTELTIPPVHDFHDTVRTILCSNNQLTTLIFPDYIVMYMLDCSNNQLTELDFSTVHGLSILACTNNQLRTLDFSGSYDLWNGDYALRTIKCHDNQLTELVIANLQRMSHLDCSNNQLTELVLPPPFDDVDSIGSIICNNNQLTELDLSRLNALTFLDCDDNSIESLALPARSKIETLQVGDNPISVLYLPTHEHTGEPTLSFSLPARSRVHFPSGQVMLFSKPLTIDFLGNYTPGTARGGSVSVPSTLISQIVNNSDGTIDVPAGTTYTNEVGVTRITGEVERFTPSTGTLTNKFSFVAFAAGDGSISGTANGKMFDGDPISVTASPNPGSQFDGWYLYGVHTSDDLTYSDNISEDIVLEARFSTVINMYTLTVSTPMGGAISGNTSGTYSENALINLFATPMTGIRFVNWTDGDNNVLSTSPTLKFNITTNIVVTANFALDPTQAVIMFGGAGTGQSSMGTVSSSHTAGTYVVGTRITVIATPREGYKFDGWASALPGMSSIPVGDLVKPIITFALTEMIAFNALFSIDSAQTKYSLATSSVGSGFVTGNLDSEYLNGTNVQLTAIANTGHLFVEWTDDSDNVLGTDITLDVLMDANKTIIAKFSSDPLANVHQLRYAVPNDGEGGIISGPGSGLEYNVHTEITLVAIPNDGYEFAGWTILAGTVLEELNDSVLRFNIIDEVEVVANFTAIVPVPTFILSILKQGNGNVAGATSGTYMINSAFTLWAIADEGHEFVSWIDGNGNEVSKNVQLNVVLTSDLNVTAKFSPLMVESGPEGGSESTTTNIALIVTLSAFVLIVIVGASIFTIFAVKKSLKNN